MYNVRSSVGQFLLVCFRGAERIVESFTLEGTQGGFLTTHPFFKEFMKLPQHATNIFHARSRLKLSLNNVFDGQ
jgi:hypothetical protein